MKNTYISLINFLLIIIFISALSKTHAVKTSPPPERVELQPAKISEAQIKAELKNEQSLLVPTEEENDKKISKSLFHFSSEKEGEQSQHAQSRNETTNNSSSNLQDLIANSNNTLILGNGLKYPQVLASNNSLTTLTVHFSESNSEALRGFHNATMQNLSVEPGTSTGGVFHNESKKEAGLLIERGISNYEKKSGVFPPTAPSPAEADKKKGEQVKLKTTFRMVDNLIPPMNLTEIALPRLPIELNRNLRSANIQANNEDKKPKTSINVEDNIVEIEFSPEETGDFQPAPEDSSSSTTNRMKPKEFLQVKNENDRKREKELNSSLENKGEMPKKLATELNSNNVLTTLKSYLTFTEMKKKLSQIEEIYRTYFSTFYNHINSREELRTLSIFVIVVILLIIALLIKGSITEFVLRKYAEYNAVIKDKSPPICNNRKEDKIILRGRKVHKPVQQYNLNRSWDNGTEKRVGDESKSNSFGSSFLDESLRIDKTFETIKSHQTSQSNNNALKFGQIFNNCPGNKQSNRASIPSDIDSLFAGTFKKPEVATAKQEHQVRNHHPCLLEPTLLISDEGEIDFENIDEKLHGEKNVINGGELNPEQKKKMLEINLLGDEILDENSEEYDGIQKRYIEHRRLKSDCLLEGKAEKKEVKKGFAQIGTQKTQPKGEEASQESSNPRLSYLIQKKIIAETIISKCCIPNEFKLKKSLK